MIICQSIILMETKIRFEKIKISKVPHNYCIVHLVDFLLMLMAR